MGSNDELNIIIMTPLVLTGSKGNVLESYSAFLSSGAKTTEGDANYYADVLVTAPCLRLRHKVAMLAVFHLTLPLVPPFADGVSAYVELSLTPLLRC